MSKEYRKLNYLGVSGEDYVPYVPADKVIPEFTVLAIILGTALAIVFGMANAYLGLKAGMTVSASIPAAVMSMAVLKGILKRGTILENTIAQTIASSGEATAAGVIFTIPALFLWGMTPDLFTIFLMAAIGGSLGVLIMIPLRRFLIVKEHQNLPYPEGTACAEVLVVGDQGGLGAKTVFLGLGIGALYKALMGAFGMWEENPEWTIPGIKGAAIGVDVLPALLGVGFIIGPRTAFTLFAGSLLSWFVFLPLIYYFGSGLTAPLYPATDPITALGHWGMWSKYIRYIGAGGVAVGGLISLIKAMPIIIESFAIAMRGLRDDLGGTDTRKRTQQDLPLTWVLIGAGIIFLVCWLLPQFNFGIVGALLILIFSFFFGTVSSRIVGLIGSSSNPVSGMTIGTLIVVSFIFKSMGWVDTNGMIAALSVGAIACMAIAMAGDTSQDLKTAFLVGSTPKYQQIAEFFGVIIPAVFIGWTLFMLNAAYGFGSKDLAAPQATLMSFVVKGVISGSLPWGLVFVGGAVAVICELIGISALAFSVGMYLPIHLNAAIAVGGLLNLIVTKLVKREDEQKARIEEGVLLSSGMIAGDSLMGIVIAFLVYKEVDWSLHFKWGGYLNEVSLLIFLLLGAYLLYHVLRHKVDAETAVNISGGGPRGGEPPSRSA